MKAMPKEFKKLPMVYFKISDNSDNIMVESGASTAIIQVTIDVFALTTTEVESIARLINNAMSINRFKRTLYDTNSDNNERGILMYMAEVNLADNTIYNP